MSQVWATGSEVDSFHAAAADALLLRSFRSQLRSDFKPAAGAEQLCRVHSMEVVKRDLQLRGVRFDQYGAAEDIAATWLRSMPEFSIYSPLGTEGGVTAAAYPNLLSAFAGRFLSESIKLAGTTWRRWCGRRDSVSDLNLRMVLAMSDAGYMPEIAGDGDPTPEGSRSEEVLGWFVPHRRAKKLKLTPYMAANDELGAFMNQFAQLELAQDRTIDMMAINLLTSNPVLLDGTPLFHADRGNLIDTGDGGAPTADQAKLVRLKMARQKGVGTDDPIDAAPAVVLVPIELEDDAKKTYFSTAQLAELVTKSADANINLYRGTLQDVISTGRLDAVSTQEWYAFADAAIYPVISVVFQTGYENGKRESWWDPDTQCRYFRHEVRVAVYAAGHRGAVKNKGA